MGETGKEGREFGDGLWVIWERKKLGAFNEVKGKMLNKNKSLKKRKREKQTW